MYRLAEAAPVAATPATGGYEDLAKRSPRDKPWDRHRGHVDDVAAVFAGADEGWIRRYAERMHQCAPWLRFAQVCDHDTGELSLHLDAAGFCRVRECPVCQWRRSLMWKARMYQALPKLAKAYPAARWVFLTLTVRNCAITDLRRQLSDMGKAWTRLTHRKEFRDVLGWVRSVEVTRSSDGSAHPHFHCLLLVSSTYWRGDHYVKTAAWVRAWRESMRIDYDPICDVRGVHSRGAEGVAGAVAETLKYAVKPSDMLADSAWFLELTRQLRRTRAVASGGVLAGVMRDETDQADLLNPGEEKPPAEDAELPGLTFSWRDQARKYQRKRA